MSIMMINPFWTAAPPAIGSYVTSTAAHANNSATYSDAGVSIGAADAARIVVVVAHWELTTTNRFPTFITLDGVNMTEVQRSSAASGHGVGIYSLAKASGTTATIACAGSNDAGVFLGFMFSVYRILPASATPVDSGTTGGVSNLPDLKLTDIEVKRGGFLVCAAAGNSNTSFTAVYNGSDTPIIDLQSQIEVNTCRVVSWSINTLEDSTTNDPGVSGPTNSRLVAASWF